MDGYAAYQTATKSGADGPASATLAFCWAHVRRKFFEAKQFAPACEQVLGLIGEVYAIEADLPVEYMLKLWGGLTVFLNNPVVPIDNNHVERQMRDRVMGRKNHLTRPPGAMSRRPPWHEGFMKRQTRPTTCKRASCCGRSPRGAPRASCPARRRRSPGWPSRRMDA